ncbi:MAG: PLP-dependent aminotransferase family protein [Bryobacteraceae bacterium]
MPLYRQVSTSIAELIGSGGIQVGERLPATRELAGQLGLNRTTISAAYALLEEQGLIHGHVGRGSFVASRPGFSGDPTDGEPAIDWDAILPGPELNVSAPAYPIEISFSSSRPSREAFPLASFRRLAREVIDGPQAADILQLGSPHGYGPLRRYLHEEATTAGTAGTNDDLIITNGCQQAWDLLARVLAPAGTPVVLEDPIYHGLWQVFARSGAEVIPAPVTGSGVDTSVLEQLFQRHRPRLAVITPSFQNPTGATLPLNQRHRVIELAKQYNVLLLESDIYSELRYREAALPRLKQLDTGGRVVLLGSYSKVAFPGLRVGWVIAPRPLVAHLAALKQLSDLHSDHLSQAVLLRFAESGELRKHIERTRHAGAQRLDAVLHACREHLPAGARFTRPDGGMSLWVELPAPLRSTELLARVQAQGVDFLPGSCFSAERSHPRGLRLSFGGLLPEQIERGVRIIGDAAKRELQASAAHVSQEPVTALV